MENIRQKFQDASDHMLNSLKNDDLEQSEREEWYGYIRGVRDCANDCGLLNETTIQENLEEALELMKKKH